MTYTTNIGDLPAKPSNLPRRCFTLKDVSGRIWKLMKEIGGTQEHPRWQWLAEELTKDSGIEINRGLLSSVANMKTDSPKVRLALHMPSDTRKGDYRPRYSPARMRAVLASPDAQRDLLDELLAEFERRLQP